MPLAATNGPLLSATSSPAPRGAVSQVPLHTNLTAIVTPATSISSSCASGVLLNRIEPLAPAASPALRVPENVPATPLPYRMNAPCPFSRLTPPAVTETPARPITVVATGTFWKTSLLALAPYATRSASASVSTLSTATPLIPVALPAVALRGPAKQLRWSASQPLLA